MYLSINLNKLFNKSDVITFSNFLLNKGIKNITDKPSVKLVRIIRETVNNNCNYT